MNTKFFNHYPREWDTLGNEWKEIITGDVLSISQASELSGFSKRFIYAQIHRLTVEDLIGEVLAEAKECLKPGIIDGFFYREVLIKKSLLKSIERKKANT